MGKLITEYLDIGDARIAYREHAAGPALILLHGNSESKGIFYKYQTVYFKTFRTIAIDSRGHGETVSNDTQYSISQYSEDVIGLCKTKRITNAYVIGYSDGGNIALFLAKKEPGIFKKIVAISPNYLASGTTDGMLKFLRAAARILRILARLGLPTQKATMRFDLMLNDIGITAEELGTIETSLRILYAEKDLIKEDHIKAMGKLIPGATIRKIMHCNHLTILNKGDTIDDIKAYFLEEER
jgi:pimeloyl-ACP methyl ester carboxylesterase